MTSIVSLKTIVRRACLSALLMGLVFVPFVAERAIPGDAGAKTLTAEQKEKLKERDRLVPQIRKLRGEGKLEDAAGLLEKMLALEKSIFGEARDEIAESLAWLSEVQVERRNVPAARAASAAALKICLKLHGDKHWRTADARVALADVDLLSKLTPQDIERLQNAKALEQQADRLHEKLQYREAEKKDRAALAIRQELLGRHRQTAKSHARVADDLRRNFKYEEAEKEERQALAIRREVLGDDHPQT